MAHLALRLRPFLLAGLASLAVSFDSVSWSAEPSKAAKPSGLPQTTPSELIYDGGLRPGWQDWGWGSHDLSQGAAKIVMAQYGGFILHRDGLSGRFASLAFQMKAPPEYGDFLRVKLGYQKDDASYPEVDVTKEHVQPLKDGWVQVTVPWNLLNPSAAPVERIMIHARAVVGTEPVKFDKIMLLPFDAKAVAKALAKAPTRAEKLAVRCNESEHPISQYIYGAAGGGDDLWELGATARRWGGNPTTRYNYQVNAYNVGKDWFFENGKAEEYRHFLDDNRKHGLATALTIPTIGWVAKDTTASGFPVSIFGPQRATDQWRPDAGDGVKKDGTVIRPGPPTHSSIAAPPSFMKTWVETILREDAKGGQRSVHMYFLDNEPNLWNSTHRDVHPDPLTYDELLDRTIKYASAIRAADPKAIIAGPAEWGWTGYFYSAADTAAGVQQAPDRRAHGDMPLVPWYLKKLAEYEKTKGTKLLDVLDLHMYPQAANVYGGGGTDPATAKLRIRSTRALWDIAYPDESWINDAVRLIPRMKEWVNQNYPGLAISIGEWNFGGERHMSGALALAEALGRFGREGVDYAYYWTTPPRNSPAFWAFRAFRNYDAKGGHFLESSLATQMGTDLSIYASRDASHKHMVVVTLNFDPTKAANASIAIDGCGRVASYRKFTYGPHTDSITDEGAKSAHSIQEFLPPYSINVFDITVE
jgi:Glycoside hydrolase family 44